MNSYDVVQAYSTDPIIPLLCGYRRFAAYEHGTLREIPFEDTARGRICSFAYREAPIVFVTNTDVLPSVRRLGIESARVVRLPHAVDSARLFRFAAEHRHVRAVGGGDVVFYSPSRQDWVDPDPSFAKGNDRFVRALALIRGAGVSFRAVLTDWGRDAAATRDLVADLSLDDVVEWIEPLRKRLLWQQYLSAHAVVDQFITPAMGGVTFEALALGCRVVTALDMETARDFFGAPPPLFSASDTEEIAAALESVARDPLDVAERGPAARRWFEQYHSADRVVDLETRAYERILAAHGHA